MKKTEWEELDRRLVETFGSWLNAKRSDQLINDHVKLAALLRDAYVYASGLYPNEKRSWSFKSNYRYASGTDPQLYGPAGTIASNLPDPGIFTPPQCAEFYLELLKIIVGQFVPGQLFLLGLNYMNSLTPRIEEYRFTDTHLLDDLERQMRGRLCTSEIIDLIFDSDSKSKTIRDNYQNSIRRVADNYLRHRDFVGSVNFLRREFAVRYDRIISKLYRIKYLCIFNLHYYNQLLGVLPAVELPDANGLELTEQELQLVNDLRSPNLEFEISDFFIAKENGTVGPDSTTQIYVAVAAELPSGCFDVDGWKLTTVQITDPFDDPNFWFIHKLHGGMNGFPLASLSPTLQSDTLVTLLIFETDEIFHPDFDIDPDGRAGEVDVTYMRSTFGEEYDPYIAKISTLISTMSEVWNEIVIPDVISKIDAYTVNYSDSDQISTHQIFRPVVKVEAFIASRDRFVNRFITAVKAGGRRERLTNLLARQVSDARELRNFAVSCIEELIVRPCSKSDLWKTIWLPKTDYSVVRPEPDLQRDIYHILNPWFEFKGMILDREVQAAGGAIDFLISAPFDGNLLRCAVEVKYAHNANIIDGMKVQLPLYMNDKEIEYGVYLFFWCKGGNFLRPEKYSSSEDLERGLKLDAGSTVKVSVLAANAAFREPPSKRRSQDVH